MTTILQPDVSLQILSAFQPVQNQPQKILFVGQMLESGTATPGILVENINNSGAWYTLFGHGSHIARMINAAKLLNPYTQMDAIGLSDGEDAVAASGTIAFTGPASAAGTLTIYIGSQLNNTYTLNITDAQTATEIGALLVDAIDADPNAFVSAVNTAGSVALTALNAGPIGNYIGLSVTGAVAGVGYTVTGMASGATNPDFTDIFDQLETIRYQTVIWPEGYPVSEIQDFLDPRFNAVDQILDGVAVITNTASYDTLVSTVSALNDQSLCIIPNAPYNSQTYTTEGSIAEYDDVISSIIGSIRALRLTDGAPIANYVNQPSPLDAIGGPAIASLPYFNTPIPNLPLVPQGEGFTLSEIEGLFTAGVSVIGNNVALTSMIMGEFVSTYKTNPIGNPDPTFQYLEYVDTESNIREYFYNNLKSNYAQCRLTTGGLISGHNMANADSIAAYCVSLYAILAGAGYVLCQAGEQALQFFKDNLVVTLNLSNGSASVSMVVPIVVQLRQINVAMTISFTTT